MFERITLSNNGNIIYNSVNKPQQLLINIISLKKPKLYEIFNELRKYITECTDRELIPDIILLINMDKKFHYEELDKYFQKFLSLAYFLYKLYKGVDGNINLTIKYRTNLNFIFIPFLLLPSLNIIEVGCDVDLSLNGNETINNLLIFDKIYMFNKHIFDNNNTKIEFPRVNQIKDVDIFKINFYEKHNLIINE